ncbi:MAG: RsmE family RNA methyltransferase [Edaphobacter sp.]|uniref:RsmE family RNA methyltransferase n=1 Tax=Edaphobacter sp. TaxID=1934404 RepID=UPI0023A25630|nr:RsmE family RNA methyltransferase [Edaphobacter sp.]MDE1177628.1 RsmE family RNA methyltransferase [Edaphobacter sp.]
MTRRRWIADTWTETTASLTGEQAEHLARVLRAEPGQIYDVVAGGFLHRAEIVSVRPSGSGQSAEVAFTLHEELESDSALPLHLLLAIFKFDHMEWAIEKATELGVARITPIIARRSEKHLAQAATKRAERWRRIALEASKQSRRTTIPDIADPQPLATALKEEVSAQRILLSETEQSMTLLSALQASTSQDASIALAIGPEGGWTAEEMALFTAQGWQHVTLGPRILRAETAAISAIAIVGSQLG